MNSIKILHTSDWHLGQNFMNKSRVEEHKAFLSWLIATIKILLKIKKFYLFKNLKNSKLTTKFKKNGRCNFPSGSTKRENSIADKG